MLPFPCSRPCSASGVGTKKTEKRQRERKHIGDSSCHDMSPRASQRPSSVAYATCSCWTGTLSPWNRFLAIDTSKKPSGSKDKPAQGPRHDASFPCCFSFARHRFQVSWPAALSRAPPSCDGRDWPRPSIVAIWCFTDNMAPDAPRDWNAGMVVALLYSVLAGCICGLTRIRSAATSVCELCASQMNNTLPRLCQE
ncbi:hypothetical protein V8C35DRAFT_94086 [Trichoderma chlorosporum]